MQQRACLSSLSEFVADLGEGKRGPNLNVSEMRTYSAVLASPSICFKCIGKNKIIPVVTDSLSNQQGKIFKKKNVLKQMEVTQLTWTRRKAAATQRRLNAKCPAMAMKEYLEVIEAESESRAQNPVLKWSIPRTMLQELRRRMSAAIYGWDCPYNLHLPGF